MFFHRQPVVVTDAMLLELMHNCAICCPSWKAVFPFPWAAEAFWLRLVSTAAEEAD